MPLTNSDKDVRFLSDKDIEEYVKRYVSRAFFSEQLSGTANGSNAKFISSRPFSKIQVFVNGVCQDEGTDFSVIDNQSILFSYAPDNGSKITAHGTIL